MANNDDVLIIGSLKDKDLRDSINELVNFVGDKTNDMANKFTEGLDKMKLAMKDFAITQKVSVDLMKDAWRDMSSAFDTMVAAQSNATGSNRNGGNTQSYNPNTVGALEQELALMEKERKEIELGTQALRDKNLEIEKTRDKLKQETTSDPSKQAKAYANEIQKVSAMYDKTLPEAERKLRELLRIKNELRATPVLDETKMERLNSQIKRLIASIRDMRTNAKGNTLKDVLGMDESSVDAIARKMRALKSVKVSNSSDIHKLGDEYQRLSRLQADLLGKGIQLTHSNNYLAQSFGYIHNRIVYALTLGAVTSFTKQVYEIRGQYELLERSLGILIDDMRKGSEMFNELNQMALKSPFTLMELATGAKQLLAYNFAEEEVVDTTRRLADISAALGVPMERLVYNLGQIRAQTVLTARDARDFANAGLAIVPMLAQMYTEEKRFGDEIVTTAQVFDMMSNKMVSYNDVMKVINKVTDEGGKFFDFQAKQADTLRVKMANLTLAWNNMLNEVGQDNQGVLELPLRGLKTLFENWRALVKVVKEVILVFGAYKAAAMLVSLWNSRLAVQGTVMAFFELAKSVRSAKDAMILFNTVCKLNPIGLIASAIAAAVGYFYLFNDAMDDAGGYTEKFGKAGAKIITETEALFDTLKGMSRESSNYKKVMGELNSILEEYGIETVKETDGMDVLNEKRRVAIALIKEETLERKHLNDVQQGRDEYASTVEEARNKMRSQLKEAVTGMYGFVSANDELRQNASAIANIISDVVEQNITLIAGKTGEEYEKGVNKIYDTIQERMRDIGISESTISKQWLDDTLFLKNDIVADFIGKIREAKEEQDRYIESIDKAYESEKKAAESGASFNDRVEQTQTQLMKAANDTENFYKKVDQLVKDYSGLNIIDFLVKVKTEVPAWMSQKGLTELTQLSARFTALATQAKKAGKDSLNVNGKEFSVEQLFQRAAQYAQAAESKAKDIESRKSSTITKEASDALKNYKAALDAATVAQNRFNRGKADQALVTEKTKAVQEAYNKALDAGVSKEELAKSKNKGKGGGSKKDPLGDALTKEIQLITDMRKMYKEYQKAGVDADTARIASAKEYEKTLKTTNATLQKYGIKGLSGKELATMDLRKVRDYYKSMLETASRLGNTKGVAALEKAIHSLNTEITKIDYKKITDGLNNELGKLKDEYELAIELDANPELGNMFADMFDITPEMLSEMPHTVGQLVDKYQDEIDKQLKDNFNTPFDILKTDIDKWAKDTGVNPESDLIKALSSTQNKAREMVKKTFLDTQKMIDDYISEYGDQQQQIEKIEKEKNNALLQLNSIYNTEALRQTKEYINAKEAIENAARIKSAKASFDALKKTTDYERFFNAIDTLTSKDALAIKAKIKQGIIQAFKDGGLTVSEFRREIKALESQFDKLTESSSLWTNYLSGGFDKLIQKAKETGQEIEAIGESISIKGTIDDKDKNFLQSMGSIFSNGNGGNMDFTSLMNKFGGNMKGLGDAVSQAGQGMQQGAGGFASAVAVIDTIIKNVHQTVQAIGSVIDELDSVRNEDSKISNAYWEGFKKFDNYAMSGWENLKSGNVAGAIGDTANSIISVFNTFSNAKNEKINKQIKESERTVKDLENAYKNLSAAIDDSLGNAEIKARRAAVENKKLQLAELERQLQLEQSRSSKRRDKDRIKELQGQIIDAKNEIKDLTAEITSTLLGNDIKSAAEDFVSTWVAAWRQGEDTMDALNKKFDGMIDNMIAKSVASYLVSKRLQRIFDAVDEMTSEKSEGGAEITMNELKRIKNLIGDKSIAEQINQDLTNLYGALDIAYGVDSETNKNLSALQQGIQGVTEDTAGSIEAYMNIVAQRIFEQNQYLQEIRNCVISFNLDVQLGTLSQMLLQLQQSYQVQLAIQGILNGWSTPNGMAVRVEMN